MHSFTETIFLMNAPAHPSEPRHLRRNYFSCTNNLFFFFCMHLMDFCRKTLWSLQQQQQEQRTVHARGMFPVIGSLWVCRAFPIDSPLPPFLSTQLEFPAALGWQLYVKTQNSRGFTAFAFLCLGNTKQKWPERLSIRGEVISRCGFGIGGLDDCGGILRMETSGQRSNTCLAPAWLRRPETRRESFDVTVHRAMMTHPGVAANDDRGGQWCSTVQGNPTKHSLRAPIIKILIN